MRIVLQSNASSLYLGNGRDFWTSRFREARTFGTVQDAMDFSQQQQLSDMQVVAILDHAGRLEFIPFQIPAPVQTANPTDATWKTW